mgnify:CR=1 FL=1
MFEDIEIDNDLKDKKITKDFQELEEKRGEVYTKLPESLKEYLEDAAKAVEMIDPSAIKRIGELVEEQLLANS